MTAQIEAKELTKFYRKKRAVENVSFHIQKGEIFGIVGENGAGKSTLLKMLSGIVLPDSGTISFTLGGSEKNQSLFERIGVLIEGAGTFPGSSAYENMKLLATAYGIPSSEKRICELLHLIGLDQVGKKKVKNFSMGMKQRLGIGMALLGHPDILILDEPINGLDPSGIADIRNLILELNKNGMTILISSHILDELAKVATRYAFMHQGRIIELLTQSELSDKCEERIEITVDKPDQAAILLEKTLGISKYKIEEGNQIYIYDLDKSTQDLSRSLIQGGVSIDQIQRKQITLEEYFLIRTNEEDASHA